jgi:hypothetical protein
LGPENPAKGRSANVALRRAWPEGGSDAHSGFDDLTIATVLTAAPARAQTYDPSYPVCLHVWARGATYYECRYTSLPQCNASASGRGAPSASSIHILPARRCPLLIGGIAPSTEADGHLTP